MHMDRTIFNTKASVYATSLYILICAMLDEGEMPTLDRTRHQWNETEENLTGAAEELIRRGILKPMSPLAYDKPLQVNPSDKWRRLAQSL